MKTGKGLIIVIITLVIGVCVFSAVGAMAGYSPEVDLGTQKNILDATVQIYMFSLMRDGALANASDARLTLGEAQQHIAGDVSYCMGHGLGTLVMTDQGALIVTHDHWGEVLESADVVEFRDASGRPLQTITGIEFRMSVLYRDAGTMVLVAPAGVNLVPANLGDSRQAPLEGVVLITRQNPDGSGSV
ncbi:MAG: hypothetical protein JXA78_11015 [Anaerolineales bacterium]|nr:hypothetical protein [Anaerolineales bacterium]